MNYAVFSIVDFGGITEYTLGLKLLQKLKKNHLTNWHYSASSVDMAYGIHLEEL